VLCQTIESLEVVVVVDGPDPETEVVLAKITDARLRVVVLPASGGAPAGRNAGFSGARGAWIALLDDDDEWLPNKLERQLHACGNSSFESPIVATGLIARTPLTDFVWPRQVPQMGEPICEYLMVRSSLFSGEKVIQTSTVMARRELFLKIPYSLGLRRHQDWDWLLRAMKCPGVGLEFVKEPLAIFHIEENRDTISSHETWQDSLAWARKNRKMLTDRAYAAFVLVYLSQSAARKGEWRAFLPLLIEGLRSRGAKPIDLTLFFGIWLIPAPIRRKLRVLFTGKSRPRGGCPELR
jgi:glycosyltransferase involved in cell wall biosynthesis